MKTLFKAIIFFASILLFTIVFAAITICFVFFPRIRVPLSAQLVHRFGRFATKLLGIKVTLNKDKRYPKEKGVFFVSNHLSYLDGIIASSLAPLIFIARADLKNWPLLGIFSLLSDTVFVNRLSPSRIHQEIAKAVGLLNAGANLILYPESTSSDGKALIPFKSPFFAVPMQAECLIVPLAIQYRSVNRQALNEKNKDLLYWYGEMEFFPHFISVLKLREISVEVNILPAIKSWEIGEKGLSGQRKYLCEKAQQAILTALKQNCEVKAGD
jgi:1-acyl-sn-glycerol-3-phosphate acyltransferase